MSITVRNRMRTCFISEKMPAVVCIFIFLLVPSRRVISLIDYFKKRCKDRDKIKIIYAEGDFISHVDTALRGKKIILLIITRQEKITVVHFFCDLYRFGLMC